MIWEVSETVFKFRDSVIGCTLVVLCYIWLGECLGFGLQDDQTRSLGAWSCYSSLRTGFQSTFLDLDCVCILRQCNMNLDLIS